MISGTSPLVPYVCHYDTSVDVAEHHTRMHRVRGKKDGILYVQDAFYWNTVRFFPTFIFNSGIQRFSNLCVTLERLVVNSAVSMESVAGRREY